MKFTLFIIKNCLTFSLLILLITLLSCVKEKVEPVNGIDGLDGFNALVDIQAEPAGENCASGGLKINVGQDINENGVLDEIEIESISFVCNGASGSDGQTPSNLLAQTSAEQPGSNCELGGTLIEIGADINSNELLDSDEVMSSFFICNGSDGSDGNDGSNGTDGYSSIIRATSESSGDNCASGGIKIEIGLDSNDNQQLDSEEIQSTYFICNGQDGTDGINGLNTLSNVISEPTGENCENGGYRIEVGLDSNNDGTLDAGEVSSENYICNGNDGADGNNGFSSLIRISTELPGSNCSDGGMKVEVGLDDVTVNGTLDDDEVDFTQYVCDGLNGGENGLSTIIQTTTEEPGGNCSNGGVKIQVGLDANLNNEIDAGEEIGNPFFVCNGQNGADGVDGSNGENGKDVIVISTPAATCFNGGTTLAFGYDENKDGDLSDDEDEILTTVTICNGVDGADGTNGSDGENGYNTIIITTQEDSGTNCANGGLAFAVGLDMNRNNEIDEGEEIDTYYVCNGSNGNDGSNGKDVIVSSSAATSCANGGFTLEFGYDGNSDGDLNDTEDTILASTTICNGEDGEDGANGYNTIIDANAVEPGDDCVDGGMAFKVGLDINRNNAIDTGEEIDTYFVCNGSNGNDGADGRNVIVTSSAATSCANGGITLEFGYDGNNDGDLDDTEDTVLSSNTICNGADGENGTDGYNTIIDANAVEPGDDCANGGMAFRVGLDMNRNNLIDAGEEIDTYFVCNGSNGRDVIVTSSAATSCANGGVTLEFGYDGNNDGDLNDAEDTVLSSTTICNGTNGSDGTNGFNTIIATEVESPGDNCANGGTKFIVGLDTNRNNEIDAGEEVGTYFVCNGNDGSNGNNSLIDITSFSNSQGGCADGGLRVDTGIDTNNDGNLQAGEILATAYVCNGSDGSDGSDGNSDGVFEFYFQEGFDGYSGVVDLSITDKNGNESGETFSVDNLNTDSHALLYFPELTRMEETIGTPEYEIVEAILYLKGQSSRIDGASNDNWIGVKTIKSEVSLFKEELVTWSSIDGNQNWTIPGVTSNNNDGDANAYSDMYRLPNDITFKGYIPLLLNKAEVTTMVTKEANKGLVLLMANDNVPYELDIISSDNTKNTSDRPTLYIKAKVTSRSRGVSQTHRQQKAIWDKMTYQEKLAPLRRR